ncbi:MAG: BrnT family toxin [Nitrospira sp.]|nr:BrnT family toxin [Nitrospira sp.]
MFLFNIKNMEITEFEWDENNIEHIFRHNVLPDEIEDVAFEDEPWIKKGRQGTRYMLGYTVSGRYLFTVYILKGKGIARVITSMDMDEKTRKLYRKRGK